MITLPLSVIILHWLADWPLQSNWIALHKAKHWDVLVIHVTIYTFVFYLAGFSWHFLTATFLLHLLTDAITSRLTSKFWFIDLLEPLKSEYLKYPTFEFARVYPRKRYYFFNLIGFDQLLHYAMLAITLKYTGG